MPRNYLYEDAEEPMVTMTIRMPKWLKDALIAEGYARRRPAADVVRLLLLERYEDQKPKRDD